MALVAGAGSSLPGPLETLDLAITGVVLAFLAAAGLSYHLTPRLCDEEPRPSFWSFCTASWVLRKIPGPDAPATTVKDLPWSRGTESFNPDVFIDRLRRVWAADGERSLGNVVLRLMLPAWAAVHAVRGPGLMFAFLDAYVISCIRAYVGEATDATAYVVLRIAALLMLKELGTDLLYCMSWFTLNNTGVNRVSVPLQVMLLRKLRALAPEALCATSVADVQQLMQDTRRLDDVLWSSPACTAAIDAARCLVALWSLAAIFGHASVCTGVASGIVVFRLQAACSSHMQRARALERSANHGRLAALRELTDTFETLKLYDWAAQYSEPLQRGSQKMAVAARRTGVLLAVNEFLGSATGDAFLLIAFALAVLAGGAHLGVEAFVQADIYVQILRESTKSLFDGYHKTMEIGRVTAKLDSFLRLRERAPSPPALEEKPAEPRSEPRPSEVDLRGASFAWPGTSLSGEVLPCRRVLSGVDLHVGKGELVIVSGPVGGGKSSLLLSLLGETALVEGVAQLSAQPVAYHAQAPCLWNGTVRENVLLGVDRGHVDEARFRAALRASLISIDMGDPKSTLQARRELTQVGHRGSEVSGGQRARIALARSVYAVLSGVEVVLLDDPLAAVDNEIVAAAWEAAVLRAMAPATRVVVVNSQLLKRLGPDADRILILEEGRLVFNGSPSQLAGSAALRSRLGGAYDVCPKASPDAGRFRKFHLRSVVHAVRFLRWVSSGPIGASPAQANGSGCNGLSSAFAKGRVEAPAALEADADHRLFEFLRCSPGMSRYLKDSGAGPRGPPGAAAAEPAALQVPGPPRLSSEEWAELRSLLREFKAVHHHRWGGAAGAAAASGAASASASPWAGAAALLRLFRRTLLWTAAAMFFAFVAEGATPCATMFLSGWETGRFEGFWGNTPCRLAIFFGLVSGKSVLGSAGALMKSLGQAQVSLALRTEIDRALVSLAMPFFWNGGKIADVRAVVTTDLSDFEHLASIPIGVAQNLFGLLAVMLAVPQALPVVLLAGLAWRWVSFPKTWVFTQVIPMFTREVYQNPLTIAAEEHQVLMIIRAMRAERHFDLAMQRTAMHLVYGRFCLWGGLLLKDVLSLPIKAMFVMCAIGCVVHVKAQGGDVAHALVLYNIAWGLVRKINDLNWKLDKAIERLVQYRNIEDFVHAEHSEQRDVGEQPEPSWPSAGAVRFEDVVFRYCAGGPVALNGVTVRIRAGEKVGVVGPTGGGKTTFLKLLFRLGPCSAGGVFVDGVDIATLRLGALRRAIGVVPQEPTIFLGTLRENLLGANASARVADDAAALAAAAACGLEEALGLAERGAAALDEELPCELSVGQKQLLAAARVLIRRPKVLVLDEATASLSQAAADHLVAVIQKHCHEATVLSIAHRLRFILQCHRVLVLSFGGTVEAFDSPAALSRGVACGGNEYFARQLRREGAEE